MDFDGKEIGRVSDLPRTVGSISRGLERCKNLEVGKGRNLVIVEELHRQQPRLSTTGSLPREKT